MKPARNPGSQPAERRIGLARALSKLGYCSRSRAFELIRAGKVRVDSAVRRNPESPMIRLGVARIEVNGREIQAARKLYFAMNKPRGVVTTAADEKERKTVCDLLPPELPWLAPVGRLDKASEGLLLLTNDSEWASRITLPESHLPKTYHVQVEGMPSSSALREMVSGVTAQSELMRATSARLLRHGQRNCWLEIVLEEGKNRQIRRMLEALGFPVLRLVRTAIGPLELGDLPKGAIRPLTAAEKIQLDRALRAKA